MTLLFLIFKIIGCILLGILGILVVGISMIIFLPIDYWAYYEKYTESVIETKFRLFYIIGVSYEKREHMNLLIIKLFGIPIKKLDLNEEEIEESVEATKDVAKESVKAEEKVAEKTTPPRPSLTQEKVKSIKKIKKPSQKASITEMIKSLWTSTYRKGFFHALRRLLKRLWDEFKPRTLSFRMIIGKEDPAETGELIAKLTMLYPLIHQYGMIEGDYTQAGFWGEVAVGGRIRLFNLIKVLLRFALNKEVRNYIKIILNVRKVEANGI